MPGTIDSLQIQITASSSRAVTSLTKLTAAIEGVKTSLAGGFSNNLKESLDSIGTDGEQKLKHLAEALSGLKSIGKIQISQDSISGLRSLIETAASIDEGTIRNMERLSDALSGLSGLDFRGLRSLSAASGLGELGVDTDGAGQQGSGGMLVGLRAGLKDATKQTTALKKMLSSLGRVAFYRLIRSAIKAVTDALKEGTENVYKFSQAFGDSTAGVETIAQAYDRLANAGSTVTNQLGAAWASLVRAITPMLLQLIDLATRAAAALTMLFAALGGSGTYLKASASDNKKWAQSAGGAAAAAKEWRNQLLGFDEINRLEAPADTGGGGGGGGLPEDLANMFEIAEIEDWAKRAADLISSISITIDDVFFEWKNLNGEQIAKKIITGLGMILGAVTGFMFGGVPGAIKGAIAGAALGVGFSSVVFDNDGVISRGEVAEMLRGVLFALCGGVIGYSVGGVKGALLGAQIGLGVDMVLQGGNFISGGKWSGFITNLTTAMNVATGAMLGFRLGGGIPGAIIGASIGLGIDFLLKDFLMQDTSGWTPARYAKAIIAALAPTAGIMIGLAIGGPGGALIGATIGFGIRFGIKSFLLQDTSGWAPIDYAKAIIAALAPAAGAMIGLTVGGAGGALIGAAIGFGIHFLLTTDPKADGEKIGDGFLTGLSDKIDSLKDTLSTKWDEIKTEASTKWDTIKTEVTTKSESLRSNVSTKIDSLKTNISNKWEDMKSNASSKWEELKSQVSAKTESLRTQVNSKIDNLKSNVQTKWDNLKTNTTTKWEEMKSVVSAKTESMRMQVNSKIESLSSNIIGKWDNLKQRAQDKWEEIKGKISEKLDAIKDLFHFEWSLPSIKLPHFNVSWIDYGLLSLPSVSVSWYAKGGIFDDPALIGVGEAGKEAVMPLEHNTGWIRDLAGQIADYGGTDGGSTAEAVENSGDEIVSAIMAASMQIISAMRETGSSEMDFDRFVRKVTKTQNRQARAAGVA